MNVCFLAWLKEKRVGETSFEIYRKNKNVYVSCRPGIFYSCKVLKGHSLTDRLTDINDTILLDTSPRPNKKSWLQTTSLKLIFREFYHLASLDKLHKYLFQIDRET